MNLSKFKNWMLVIAMVAGATAYLLYHHLPSLHFMGAALDKAVSVIQPVLLFSMLFLTFCKVEPSKMRLRKWQLWLLLIQGGLYALLSFVLIKFPGTGLRIGIEAAMLCLICPTATACAVVTGKLGGNIEGVLTYTILINLLVSVEIPLLVPLTNPLAGVAFASAFGKILSKVFPLLIAPFLLAWALRVWAPGLHSKLLKRTHLAFYIWAVSLTLAIAVSTRHIVANEDSGSALIMIALSSLLCCAFQFAAGKAIGARYSDAITAGQALGQKNTVFAIWVGYTFMSPIASVAGGFYSIWHNCFNTWQLNRKK